MSQLCLLLSLLLLLPTGIFCRTQNEHIFDKFLRVEINQREHILFRSRDYELFYHPITMANIQAVNASECYYNPYWKASVLPIHVQLDTNSSRSALMETLQTVQQDLCSTNAVFSKKLEMCQKPFAIRGLPVTKMQLQLQNYFSLRFAELKQRGWTDTPSVVTFVCIVPTKSNCTEVADLFQERSFLQALELVVDVDWSRVENHFVSTQRVPVTRKLLLEKSQLHRNISLSQYKLVQKSLVHDWAARVVMDLLKRMHIVNPRTVLTLLDVVFQYLCPQTWSGEQLEEQWSYLENMTETIYPTINEGGGSNNASYCSLPAGLSGGHMPSRRWRESWRRLNESHNSNHKHKHLPNHPAATEEPKKPRSKKIIQFEREDISPDEFFPMTHHLLSSHWPKPHRFRVNEQMEMFQGEHRRTLDHARMSHKSREVSDFTNKSPSDCSCKPMDVLLIAVHRVDMKYATRGALAIPLTVNAL